MLGRIEIAESSEAKQLKVKAGQFLVLNIAFFLILFFAMLSVPFVGGIPAALIVSCVFVITVFYIYFT